MEEERGIEANIVGKKVKREKDSNFTRIAKQKNENFCGYEYI